MGQASWANIMSPGDKVTAIARHPTKKINKAEDLTYLSTNIVGTEVNFQLKLLF
jgi:hypothetical protein